MPVLINEYGWLWLDREGQPTCLTEKVYASLLGNESTVEQRRVLYARYLAALTEFWRCHRQCAGVLHFCGLGYSRPGNKPRPEGGATSDHFQDVAMLEFEPHFVEYVGDAFNPLGIMLDFWVDEVAPSPDSQPRSISSMTWMNRGRGRSPYALQEVNRRSEKVSRPGRGTGT